MTATAHALVGGAIAAGVKDPVLGITLSFATHPFLDMIPHWDFGWGWKKKTKITLFLQASFDLVLGLGLAFLFFGSNVSPVYLFACVFASEVWDIMETPYWFLNWRFPPFSWIYNIQSNMQDKLKLPWGILTQVAAVFIIIILLQNFN